MTHKFSFAIILVAGGQYEEEKICIFAVLVTLALAPENPGAQSESQMAEHAIQDFFKALSNFDYQGLKNLCTDDFVLFEDGQIMNLGDLINFVKPFEGKGSISYSLTDIKSNVEKSFAWIRLRNKTALSMQGFPPTAVRVFFAGDQDKIVIFVCIQVLDRRQVVMVRDDQEIVIMIAVPPHHAPG